MFLISPDFREYTCPIAELTTTFSLNGKMQGLVMEKSNRRKKASFFLSGSKKARCLLPLSLSHPRKIKVISQREKRKKNICFVLKKRHRYPETAVQTSEVVTMGSCHTKGSQNIPKIIWRFNGFPSGFLFFVFVFPLLLGHMLLTRFSAQEKRDRVQSNGDGEQELEKVLDKREK